MRQIGQLQVVLSGICFGFLGYFGKTAFAKGISPFFLLSLRFTVAGLLLFLALRLFSQRLRGIDRVRAMRATLMGALGYAVFSSFYFLAVRGLSPGMAVLLLYTYPVFVMIGGFFLYKASMSLRQVALVVSAFLGICCLVGGDFRIERWPSFLIGLASGLTYSIFILGSSRWLARTDALVSSAFIQLGAGLSLAVVSAASFMGSEADFTSLWQEFHRTWSLATFEILGLAIICSILPITLFQLGVQKLKEWEVSLLSTTEPVTALLVSAFAFGEALSVIQWFGALLVLMALFQTR